MKPEIEAVDRNRRRCAALVTRRVVDCAHFLREERSLELFNGAVPVLGLRRA